MVVAGAIFNTLVVTLLAGGSLSYFFSKTLYRPVEKLVDTLPVKKGSRDESEFQMVASTVQQLSERAKDYETQLHSQSDLLAASLTTRVLKGEIFLSPDIAEALRQGGFPIACQKFVVLILSIDEDADAGSPPIQQEEAGAFKGDMPFVPAQRWVRRLCRRRPYVLSRRGRPGQRRPGGGVKACAEAIRRLPSRSCICTGLHRLSGEHHSLDELHEAYHEATQVADYQLLAGEYGKTATYSRLSSLMSGPNGCREFLAQVNKLSNSIQSANYQQAAALVKEIEESFSKHPAAMPQAKLQIFYLTDAILLSLSDSDLDPELLNHLQNAETFRKPRSIDSLCQCTYRIFAYLDAKKEQSRPQGKRIEQITQYIRENYQDINLSAGAVAEHFHISLPVLSNLFKSELNVGFLDYLHKFRIERAKELIVHTDHTIGDISAMVGYANSITMNRAFKRYEGVTPGWYRQSASSHAAAQKGAGDVSP
ncbi:MAG: helix-turn-helix transcriptional regulator [Anaeromassilibacillus sp.]